MTPDPPGSGGLTPFQLEVARAFFAMAESSGFLLAGGAAMIAKGLSDRPTKDLDFFTAPGRGDVGLALAALEAVCAARSWVTRRVRVAETFARLVITSHEDSVEVDLALDATPGRPATMTVAGPTLDADDLAGRKLVALFNRAEVRDFADVYLLVERYGRERLLELARENDEGFDTLVLADMLQSIRRFPDGQIPAKNPAAVRAFALEWAARLREGR